MYLALRPADSPCTRLSATNYVLMQIIPGVGKISETVLGTWNLENNETVRPFACKQKLKTLACDAIPDTRSHPKIHYRSLFPRRDIVLRIASH